MTGQDDLFPSSDQRPPAAGEPGSRSTPADDEGRGVVGVEDRAGAGAPGAPAANQGKTEPIPPAPSHADPDAAPEPATVEAPDLESMNVGAADPQAPSHPAAGGHGDRGRSGVPALETPPAAGQDPDQVRPEPDPASSTGRDLGPQQPAQATSGVAFRVPGANGVTADEEQIETDVERSARNTTTSGTPGTAAGTGDAAGVPVVSEEPAPGTSQDSAVAEGSRTPL